MADEQDPPGAAGEQGQPAPGEAPEFLDQVIARAVVGLREQAPELYGAAGEQAGPLAAQAARLALWLAGLRPGGLRVLRLLHGYEVELTPQDPFGFVQHLSQALVGEAVTSHQAQTPEEASRALALEIANIANQATRDAAPFIVTALLWGQCAGLLQQTLAERAQQQEEAARRGSGKREEPDATPPAPPADAPPPAPADAPARPRILRPGEPEDEGPPPPLIFPGRR